MFGIVLDPGSHIGKVWSLAIPEGLKEVLWKEMNGVQVLGHRYYGTRLAKSDLSRFCLCGEEMSLRHILLGCDVYTLQPMMAVLTAGNVAGRVPLRVPPAGQYGPNPRCKTGTVV